MDPSSRAGLARHPAFIHAPAIRGRVPEDFVATPWEVTGEVDYDELMRRFGTQRSDDALRARIRRYTGGLPMLARRGLFFSHRDTNWILDEYERGKRSPPARGIVAHVLAVPGVTQASMRSRLAITV